MLLPAARNRGGSAPSVRPLAPRRCRRPPALLSPPLPAGLRLNRNGPGAYRSPRAPPTGPAGPEPFAGAGRGEAGDGPARPGFRRSPLPAPARRRSGAPRGGAGAGRRRGRHVGSVRRGGGGPEGSRGQSRRRRVAGKGRGSLPPSLPGEAARGGLPTPAGAAASRRCPVPHAVGCPSEVGRRCRGWDPLKSAGRPSWRGVWWAVHGRLRGLAATDGAPRGRGGKEGNDVALADLPYAGYSRPVVTLLYVV